MKIIAILITIQLLAAPRNASLIDGIDAFVDYSQFLPAHLVDLCNIYRIDYRMAYKWSQAESSCRPGAISRRQAYGRYQVTRTYLDYYCWVTRRKFPKDWTNYLLDDERNCKIWAWSIGHWRRMGYTDRNICHIWLFGETGYLNGRYSDKFEMRIFD